jgi:hypothetical protein
MKRRRRLTYVRAAARRTSVNRYLFLRHGRQENSQQARRQFPPLFQ